MREVCACKGGMGDLWKLGRSIRADLRAAVRCQGDPATRLGIALLVVTACLLVGNILAPPPYGLNPDTGLAVLNGGMDLLQEPLDTTFYLLILVGCGCWLQIRSRASLWKSGWAAAKIMFLAGIPMMAAALLIASGILHIVVLGPGEIPGTFHQHGFALTYYNVRHQVPAPWLLLLWAVLRVPESFLLGILGGLLGHGIPQRPRRSSPQPA